MFDLIDEKVKHDMEALVLTHPWKNMMKFIQIFLTNELFVFFRNKLEERYTVIKKIQFRHVSNVRVCISLHKFAEEETIYIKSFYLHLF